MASNRFHILLKALWILLKLTLRIILKVICWGVVVDITRRILLSIDAVVYYIGDFTPEQRELCSHRTILGLILLIYTCKLLIQIIIWIKYTAISLINKSDKPIRERFSPKRNKQANLIIRRVIAYCLDNIVLILIHLVPIVIKALMERKYSIRIYGSLLHPIVFVVEGAYFIYFDQSKKGSLGKRLLKLKVVDENGSKSSMKASLLRFLYFSCAMLPFRLTSIFNISSASFALFAFAWFAVWIMSLLFGKKKATLYDILSKTRVVSTSK